MHKGATKNGVQNWRPNSLTCVACKLSEHIMHRHMMKHFARSAYITPNQHGLISRASSLTLVTNFIMTNQLHERKEVDSIILDFREGHSFGVTKKVRNIKNES